MTQIIYDHSLQDTLKPYNTQQTTNHIPTSQQNIISKNNALKQEELQSYQQQNIPQNLQNLNQPNPLKNQSNQNTPSQSNQPKPNILKYIILATIITLVLTSAIFISIYFIFVKTSTTNLTSNPLQGTPLAKAEASVDTQSCSNASCGCQLNNDWTYLADPQLVQTFQFNVTKQTLLPFGSIISKTTKAKQVLAVLAVGNWANDWNDYNVRVQVVNQGKQYNEWIFGWRGPTNAAVWNSQQVRFPISDTRQFRVKVNKVLTNSHIRIYIVGWR